MAFRLYHRSLVYCSMKKCNVLELSSSIERGKIRSVVPRTISDSTTKLGILGFGIRDQLFAPTTVPYSVIMRLQYNV